MSQRTPRNKLSNNYATFHTSTFVPLHAKKKVNPNSYPLIKNDMLSQLSRVNKKLNNYLDVIKMQSIIMPFQNALTSETHNSPKGRW